MERLGVTWTPCKQTDRESGYGWVVKVENFQNGVLLPQPPDLKQKPGSLKQKPCLLLSPTSSVLSHSHPHWLIQVAQGRISTHCPQLPVNQPLLLQTDQPQIRGENLFRACKTLSPDWIFLLYNFPLCFVEGLFFFFSMCLLHRFGFLFCFVFLIPNKFLSSPAVLSAAVCGVWGFSGATSWPIDSSCLLIL